MENVYEGDEGTIGREDVRKRKGESEPNHTGPVNCSGSGQPLPAMENDYEGDEGTVGKEDVMNEAKGS